jgi:N-acetylglucosaminyl-diphospho-decaprenol L-rhamnosyltransferase
LTAKLHVALVNYNSSRELLDCISSIPIGLYDSLTIIDNDSDPTNRALLEQADFSDRPIRVEFSSENSGFGSAMNRAVASLNADRTDHIWLLNPDMVVNHEAIQKLRAVLHRGEADIVSPVITTGSSAEIIWYAGGIMDLRRGCTSHLKRDPAGAAEPTSSVSFMTGAAPMMKLSSWEQLGGFRADLFLYWEDADLSLRAAAQGVRMAVVHHARVWHKVGASSSSTGKSDLWYYFMHRNRLVVCGEYYPKISLLAGTGASFTLRLLIRACREREGALRKLLASLRGIRDGLAANPSTKRECRYLIQNSN